MRCSNASLCIYFSDMDLRNDQNCKPYLIKTSSEIIKEAKVALSVNSTMNTKIVKTNRPFTPRDEQRILFEHNRAGRPSSSISFQSIKFQDTENNQPHKYGKNDIKPGLSRTKLPSLIHHNSMSSLGKLPEEFIEIIPEQREIYSSPTFSCTSTIFNTNERIWFPHIHSISWDKPIKTNDSENIYFKSDTTLEWLDIKKSIQDNKINEARASLKLAEQNSIQNLISEINEIVLQGYKNEDMIVLLKRLYECLENDEQLQNNQNQHPNKNIILNTVFDLINSQNEKLLSHVIQIILLLRVTGENLSTVCKLVFKISRFDKNDQLFLKNNLIGLFVNCLGLATPNEDADSLIYGYGALKFLMMNLNILHLALDNGILHLMALHLKMINLAKIEGCNFPEQTSNVLFQLTGCLRNVANETSTHQKFASSSTLSAICRTIRLFISDIDLVVNVARIISILSTNDECCDVIANYENSLHTLLRICKRYPKREDIIVRIMYAIGNVLASCDRTRFELHTSSENTLEVVLNLLQFYLKIDLKLFLENTFNKSQIFAVEDVFIKIIRVVANMCIDENVGMLLVSSTESDEKFSQFLDCLLIILRRKNIYENEELVISTLSALNNLSYYSHQDLKGAFSKRCLNIAEALNSLLLTKHEECILEVGRVYSNLTRVVVVRKYLLETGGLNYIIDWLDSSNKDILLITTGILVNMMAENEARQFLKHNKGLEKLIQNLGNHAEKDWHLANLICQVIWNFIIEEDDLRFLLECEQAQDLLNVLIDLLDEDRFFSGFNDTNELWEDFSIVATNILEKMEEQNMFE